jgi:hypothetical protein
MTGWHAPKNGPPKHSHASREPPTNPGITSTLHARCKFQFPASGIREQQRPPPYPRQFSFLYSSDPLFTKTNCQSARHCGQKRMSVRLAPVKGKALVSKPAIRSKIQILEFTEVVPVQLKQVSQDRLLLWSSGGNFDVIRRAKNQLQNNCRGSFPNALNCRDGIALHGAQRHHDE